MTKKISYHAKEERKDRIEYIIDVFNGEFGTEVCCFIEKHTKTKTVLTTTGLIIVYNSETNNLVTMYICKTCQAIGLYKRATGKERCPNSVYKRVINNQKYLSKQP
jgi:hypothetical protein